MKAIRVTEEWQKAGVYYVRTQAMCIEFGISLEMEFGEDIQKDEYILVLEGDIPVATCRLRYLDEETGKIERVATRKEYRGQHYGKEAILEAERWMKEKGVRKILINSREAALGFYEKLGYIPDHTVVSGHGEFRCILTSKILSEVKEV